MAAPKGDKMKNIGYEKDELVIETISKKTNVFYGFTYPFASVAAHIKFSKTPPKCFRCRNEIEDTLVIGFAQKGSNQIFCMDCAMEFKKNGCDVTERTV